MSSDGMIACSVLAVCAFSFSLWAALCYLAPGTRRHTGRTREGLHVALLRKIAGRPRADYARLRQMEIECGLIDQVAEANAEWRALGSPDARIPGMTPIRLIRVEPKVTGH